MRSIKRIVILLFILILLFLSLSNDERFGLFVNWGIKLPSIKIEEVVFNSVFQDGETFKILVVKDKRKTVEAIKKNNFIEINEENVNDIKIEINNLYNLLEEKFKALFDQKIDFDLMLDTEGDNYYLLKNKNDGKSSILLLFDIQDNKIYCLEVVRH